MGNLDHGPDRRLRQEVTAAMVIGEPGENP
jgi:hypothetical protein